MPAPILASIAVLASHWADRGWCKPDNEVCRTIGWAGSRLPLVGWGQRAIGPVDRD